MINIRRFVIAGLVLGVLAAGLPGCKKKAGPAERAGQEIDKAVEKAGKQIEKAGEQVKDAVNDGKK